MNTRRNSRFVSAVIAALVLLGLVSCNGGSGAPLDPLSVRDVLDYQLYVIQTGMEREDASLASSPIADRFTMSSAVCARFTDRNWEGRGQSGFRGFLGDTFNLHANISCELLLTDVLQDGDLATATVQTRWRSQRTDSIPPGQYVIEETDYFFFERTGSAWRLLRWQQTPDPPPPAE